MVELNVLKKLVPLHTLADELLARLAETLTLEEVPSGTVLCTEGEREDRAVYLIQGSVELASKGSGMKSVVMGGTPSAAYALTPGSPRRFTARTTSPAKVVRIETTRLDRVVVFEELSTALTTLEVHGKVTDKSNPRVAAALAETPALQNLPRRKMKDLLERMQAFSVKPNEAVVRQGEPNEYFYAVQEGRFVVSQKDANGKVRIVKELASGDTFGEDSLLTANPSPTTVVALTPGKLLRLAKDRFEQFVTA
jgi:CRP-like cAMP-binding protein